MDLPKEIFSTDSLGSLRDCLNSYGNTAQLRERLFQEFISVSCYCSAEEWNRAVRLCECLAIIGWGEHEPVEAIRGCYFNGAPNTFFVNAFRQARFLDAVWSQRSGGIIINRNNTTYHQSPDNNAHVCGFGSNPIEVSNLRLVSQRNWIPKNPVFITRTINNCYPSTRPLLESIDQELMPALDTGMRPEVYGCVIDRIVLNCAFSFFDNYHCKTNYVIADDTRRIRKNEYHTELLKLYSEEDIDRYGLFLRPRYNIGPFRKDTGTARIEIVFEKDFSDNDVATQKQIFANHLLEATRLFASRQKHKLPYHFETMRSDLKRILQSWINL